MSFNKLTLEEQLIMQINFLVDSIKEAKEKLKKERITRKKELYEQHILEYMEELNKKRIIIEQSIHDENVKTMLLQFYNEKNSEASALQSGGKKSKRKTKKNKEIQKKNKEIIKTQEYPQTSQYSQVKFLRR
jgi:hypothetical protein